MFHNSQAVLALSLTPNDTMFQKTLALNDFYFGMDGFPFPMGNIQMIGKTLGGHRLFENLNLVLSPGVRIGLVRRRPHSGALGIAHVRGVRRSRGRGDRRQRGRERRGSPARRT